MLGVMSIVMLSGFYTFLSHRQHQKNPNDSTIPSWSQLADGITKIVTVHPRSGERWLWIDGKATAIRLFVGLGVAILGAVILGMLMGCLGICEAFFLPPLSLFAKVPPTAILAVFFVLVGIDLNMYIAMIGFGVIPSLAMSIQLSVKEVPNELIFKPYTLGASHCEVAWNVIFRHVLPNIIDATKMFIGPAMVYLIAAEMLCAGEGMGYRIRLQSRLLRMEVVYPYLAILAISGFSLDYFLRRLQVWLCPWFATRK